MIGRGQHLIVEKKHYACQDDADSQEGAQHTDGLDSAGGHGGNLVGGSKLTEGVKHRDEDGHGESQSDRVGQGEQ